LKRSTDLQRRVRHRSASTKTFMCIQLRAGLDYNEEVLPVQSRIFNPKQSYLRQQLVCRTRMGARGRQKGGRP
jgi:hypothetical protein